MRVAPENVAAEIVASASTALGVSMPHESAVAQVCGQALYVDDLPELNGTLYAAPILSRSACARLLSIDDRAARALAGVVEFVYASDLTGENVLANFSHDEPILAAGQVNYVGQVVGLVVARSHKIARQAAALVALELQELPAVLSIDDALAQQHWVLPPVTLARGDAGAAIERSTHQLCGELEVGGQEHFYLEGQIAYAQPQEQGQWLVYSSTQHPGEVQHWVAHALKITLNQVRIECRRMGGGFGGKETQAGQLAVWAALAARKTGTAVKLRFDRDDDFLITGKRHNFKYWYRVGFNLDGQIQGLDLKMASQCGYSADLSGPVNDRAIFHADNAYFLEHVRIESLRCKTNTQSNTAFRGFGGPQGMIIIENIIEDIARRLGRDALDIRQRNFYGVHERNLTHYGMTVTDNILQPLLERLISSSQYRQRRVLLKDWNRRSPVLKRGLAITPVKFGISFTATQFNQAGALVNVYLDGSVQVNHGGTEMGQGLHTKIAQIVADELGLPVGRVLVSASDTSKVPNASATAASAGTDLNGRAAQSAARTIRQRLVDYVAGRDHIAPELVQFSDAQVRSGARSQSFTELVNEAYSARIQLWSDGFYKTPKIHYDKHTLSGRPFLYFSYGAACCEVVIDTMTGESRVVAVDILHDVGRSINPAIDIGQIEGGFVQGMGWLGSEELVWNERGALTTHAPSTYKIPTAHDVPEHFVVELYGEPNPEDSIYRAKAVGEPPLMLAIGVFQAVRDAIAAVAADERAISLRAPATPEAILDAVLRVRAPHASTRREATA